MKTPSNGVIDPKVALLHHIQSLLYIIVDVASLPASSCFPARPPATAFSYKIRRMSDTGEQHASVSISIPSHSSSDSC